MCPVKIILEIYLDVLLENKVGNMNYWKWKCPPCREEKSKPAEYGSEKWSSTTGAGENTKRNLVVVGLVLFLLRLKRRQAPFMALSCSLPVSWNHLQVLEKNLLALMHIWTAGTTCVASIGFKPNQLISRLKKGAKKIININLLFQGSSPLYTSCALVLSLMHKAAETFERRLLMLPYTLQINISEVYLPQLVSQSVAAVLVLSYALFFVVVILYVLNPQKISL